MTGRACASAMLALIVAACHMPRAAERDDAESPHDVHHETEVAAPPKKDEPGRRVTEAERWSLSDPKAVTDLAGTEFGEREIREFWTRKGWRMTKKEERYLAETQALLARGDIARATRWALCPYTPVYRAVLSTNVMGVDVRADQEFHFEMCANENEVQLGRPHFDRAPSYREEHVDGHATDPSRPHAER